MIDEINMKKLSDDSIEVQIGTTVKVFPDWNKAFEYIAEVENRESSDCLRREPKVVY